VRHQRVAQPINERVLQMVQGLQAVPQHFDVSGKAAVAPREWEEATHEAAVEMRPLPPARSLRLSLQEGPWLCL